MSKIHLSLSEHFDCLTNYFFETNEDKLKKDIEKLGRLLERMESANKGLDTPLSEDNPKYACGNFLEDLKEYLEDLVFHLPRVHRNIKVWARAWERYPMYEHTDEYGDESDINADARSAYVDGYLHAQDELTTKK